MRDRSTTPAYASDWALFLDVDGTLIEFADHPDEVRLLPDTLDILANLQHQLGGALALVSGRGLDSLDQLFAPLQLPAAGLHGLERRFSRSAEQPAVDARELDPMRSAAEALVQRHPELIVEDKKFSLALHYRRRPELEAEVGRFMAEQLEKLGSAAPFTLQRGKMVLELKPALADKGSAIEAFMQREPWRGRCPVFVGDDVTDEHGFELVNTLDGHAIKVGEGATVAPCHLHNIHQVIGWLRGYVEYLELEHHEARR